MANQGYHEIDTFAIDGAPATPVLASSIVIASTANSGNAALAGAGSTGIVGVTVEDTDGNGYAGVRQIGTARVRVGASNIAAGAQIGSDASGHAVALAPSAAGAGTLKGRLGIARMAALANNYVDVDIALQEIFAA
jgi:hypothetical protein